MVKGETASDTGGVKPFSIQGRMARERERLIGMSDEERAWRRQWVKDQHLSPREPVHVPEIERELINPIRRAYKMPLDMAFRPLEDIWGYRKAKIARWWTGKAIMATFFTLSTIYYFKYNANDWTRKGGWRVIQSRMSNLPGDPDFPKLSERQHPSDYAARGFKESPI